MILFKCLGVLVGAYAAYSAMSGSVHVKSGAWGRTVERSESPEYFWTAIVIYGLVSLALITIF
jgi:hypothetical protein